MCVTADWTGKSEPVEAACVFDLCRCGHLYFYVFLL